MKETLFAIGFMCCGAPVGLEALSSLRSTDARFGSKSGYEVNAMACVIELSPDEWLIPQVQMAIDDWSRHVDCDIFIGDEGIPVTASELDGSYLGLTNYSEHAGDSNRWKVNYIKLDWRGGGYDYVPTILHELYHTLGAFEHTETGIGSAHKTIDYIDALSVEKVCEKVPCYE